MNSRHLSSGFTRVDLLFAVGTLALLGLVKFSALAAARGPGQNAVCQNNLRQLGVAVLMYSAENENYFPPRSLNPKWPEKLRPYYRDLAFLRCPNDPDPQTVTNNLPADSAARSYLYNGWNDYYVQEFPSGPPWFLSIWPPTSSWTDVLEFEPPHSIPESCVSEPSATITFGEKISGSAHYYMDYFESGGGDDFYVVANNRHFENTAGQRYGGGNYSFAEGSVRFLRWGQAVSPTNLWGVTPSFRCGPLPPAVPKL